MTKTIKTDQWYLLVDTEAPIYQDDWITRNDEVVQANDEWNGETHKEWEKIIGQLPIGNAPLLEGVPLLPPPAFKSIVTGKIYVKKKDGYYLNEEYFATEAELFNMANDFEPLFELPKQEEDVDFAKMFYNLLKSTYPTFDDWPEAIAYKAASQRKMYSEEQVRTAIELAKEGNIGYYAPNCPNYYFEHTEDEIIQSLSPVQEQEWAFEPEWETGFKEKDYLMGAATKMTPYNKLKTISNLSPHKNPILVGKWVRKQKQAV